MAIEIKGVIPAIVTPFKDDEEIDEEALRAVVRYVIQGGVHGILTVGCTGEFYSMDAEEKVRVLEIVIDENKGHVPIYAGTGAITTREAVWEAVNADRVGADALITLTPFFIEPTQDEVYDHYKAICESVSLPVIPYNNPPRTHFNISADLMERLARIPNLRGVKDSSGDLGLMEQFIVRTPPDFAVLQGRDNMFFPSFCLGAKGAVAATANLVPKLVVEIYDAFMARDLERARQAQRRLSPIRLILAIGQFQVVVKEAMEMMGLKAGPGRGPTKRLPEAKRAQLRKVLEGMGLLQEVLVR